MPNIVGILTFMSMINFVLSGVKHEKSFILIDFVVVILVLFRRLMNANFVYF